VASELRTAETTDTPAGQRAALEPLGWAALGVALIGAGTLAGAWFFELVLDIRPCPLCLEQRYGYYFAVPLALALALGAWLGVVPSWLRAGLVLVALVMLGNAGLGAYHSGVEWGFWKGPAGCVGRAIDFGSAGSLLDRLDAVKVIPCDEVQWRFLGLSLAGYNVLISLAMAALAAAGAVYRRR
jgi:disulfide bond formation protein DsbB